MLCWFVRFCVDQLVPQGNLINIDGYQLPDYYNCTKKGICMNFFNENSIKINENAFTGLKFKFQTKTRTLKKLKRSK